MDTPVLPWNFVLTGQVRSGAGFLQASINTRKQVTCHGQLFHPILSLRQEAHEAYFGRPKAKGFSTTFYEDGETPPWYYINHVVLNTPKRQETSLGLHVDYDVVRRYEFYDLLETRYREGSFGVIHVLRSPLACFISLKQAQQTNCWQRRQNDTVPPPMRVVPEELIEFWHAHKSVEAKIRASCEDRLEVPYSDLVLHYQAVMAKVFDFIELPYRPSFVRCDYRRQRNRPVRDRIFNWDELYARLPVDFRQHADSDELF